MTSVFISEVNLIKDSLDTQLLFPIKSWLSFDCLAFSHHLSFTAIARAWLMFLFACMALAFEKNCGG